jgi:rhamnose utilization protein RhaD (predicted bifunctional aldolase and dehydrogenase)
MFFRKKKKAEAENMERATLASILLSMKAITLEQLEKARAEREEHDTSHADMLLVSTLRARGFCSPDDVIRALKIQTKMIEGDRASVALDLMEARMERYREGEERIHREVERQRKIVIPFSPVTAKAV